MALALKNWKAGLTPDINVRPSVQNLPDNDPKETLPDE